ncbi:Protein of unknown function (DUF3223) [Seminavis robusta]|uniref:HTH La-type RNA-binding domain-containing protein n=1 Tax=Seminavis robusta TaxID=568900 RepID=A0A9N8HY68_9STRA|nr:Protein of unknown function (DUF3223) [Seminavis robusta]|eukprot:Sro1943_g306870.1 Protein of unknown function (DUF3223) (232) ;mRNA; r:16831-17526
MPKKQTNIKNYFGAASGGNLSKTNPQKTLDSFFPKGAAMNTAATGSTPANKRKKNDHSKETRKKTTKKDDWKITVQNDHDEEELQTQVEYYLSNANLKKDKFYRSKIISSPHGNGWIDIKYILSAPRIQSMNVTTARQVVEALKSSEEVETMEDAEEEGTFLIRRKKNKKLPTFRSQSDYQRRRRYDSYSDYGFDEGSHGFSGYRCGRLLECGVKPWDDDAGYVLRALYDY